MLRTTRRLSGPLLAAVIGAGLVVAPASAQAASVTATVRVSGILTLRAEPTTASAAAGTLGNNAQIAIDCVVSGQSVKGSIRTTTTWDRLTNGRYVSHAFVLATGTLKRCAAGSPQAEPVKTKPAAGKPATSPVGITGTVTSEDGNINLRSGPSTTATVQGTVANGAELSLVCGVVGSKVTGTVRTTTQWNRLADGRYVSHAYVVTPTLHLCKDAASVPTSTVNLTNAQFIEAAVPGAQRGWREFGVPPSVTIAQAILESGWGRSSLSTRGRNYFGIKCFDGRYGTIASGCDSYNTSECTKAGKCFSTTATFRRYSSMTNSFRDHGNFLKVNSRYKPAFSYTKSANTFIWTVWKAGYATDPNYYTKITGIMSAHKLYQYDTWK
jgi:flagellum-specific peptidoglycan hydrolase FlgJ